MAIPDGIATVAVSGRYIRPDGTPLTGTVTFEPPAHLKFPDADTIGVGPASVALDGDGSFAVTLIATDAPGMEPTGWTYTVTERLARTPERRYSIALPLSSGAVDLADVVPEDGASGYIRSRVARSDVGFYVPAGWGDYWRSKRNAADGAQARIVAVGGSSTAGWHSSDLIKTSWIGRLQTALQAQYGAGGSGFFPTSRTSTIISATSAIPAWTAAGCLATPVGDWRAGTSYPGPGVTYVYTEIAGSTLTFKVTGQTVSIYTVAGPPPAGTRAAWTYSIDGAAPVTVQDAGGTVASIQVTKIPNLSPGEHTVTLAWAGTTSDADQFLSVCGVSGENPTGVIVDNLARPGAASNRYTAQTASAGAVWNGGASWSGDLAIYSAAPNDAAATTPVTGAQWETNVVSWLRAVKAANYNTDILIVLPHIGNYESAPIYHEYSARARTIAETYGAALVNVWTLGKTSWAYWSDMGYWGTQTNPGGAGTDGVHPSDAGHQYIADQVLPLLMS